MSRLKGRVANMGSTGSAYAPVTGGAASPPSVMVMPLARVVTQETSSQYVTLGMEDLAPVWTTDGAAVPASAPGRWGQLAAATGPHPGRLRGVRSPIAGR